jgi:sortase A
MNFRIAKLKVLEVVLALAGVAFVGLAVFPYVGGRLYSRIAVAKFHADAASQIQPDKPTSVDFSLWDAKRVQEYEATLSERFDKPLALLRVSRIHLEVPVFEGTDEKILNRGVGRIAGTVGVDDSGNLGIAGHRDGFFRGLKDVAPGDSLELDTSISTKIYSIDSIEIVSPNDVSVLKSSSSSELTLVTCYPFYFVGSAPQRYIVHASLKGETKR